MTKSKRVGHWRTNAQGTTTWVTEHTLERTVYTLSKDGTNKLVNGQKLLETYCNYCYQKVFFVSLNEKKKYFNNNSEPLILHQCRIRDKKTTINKRPIKTKKFLDEKNVKALFRRVEELRKTADKIKSQKKIPSHSRQYAQLPKIYAQNASIEIAWTKVLKNKNPSISGKKIIPYFSKGFDGFDINQPEDIFILKVFVFS